MRIIWYCCCFLFFLIACGVPPRATPLSTPMVLSIALPPYLRPLSETLHTCASTHLEYVLDIVEIPVSSPDAKTADIVFRFGDKHVNGFAASIGEETIVLIVNSKNPILTITSRELGDIFTGRIYTWAEVGGKQQAIQVWTYLDGDDVRSVFDAIILPGDEITPQALLAPTPQVMLEAVSDDPMAIGYVPQIWLEKTGDWDQVRALKLDPTLGEKLRQPVLALSNPEPAGPLRQLLVCTQSAGR